MGKRKSRAKPATTKRMDKLDILSLAVLFAITALVSNAKLV
ncbi:unnamed protein product [Brassica oleracea]